MIPLGEVVTPVKTTVTADKIKIGELVLGLEDIAPEQGLLRLPDPSSEAVGSNKAVFGVGDILYGKLRPNLRKVAVATIDGVCSTEILVLRPVDDEDTWFLWSVLRGDAFTQQAMGLVAGASLPRVKPKDLMRVEIPWPEMAERRSLARRAELFHSSLVRLDRVQALAREADRALAESISQAALVDR